jgi:exodeoxyribonuclease-3
MKLVSWNVNSLKARMPRVLELLAAHAPDVVLLQETKCADDAFPTVELEAAGYRAVHHSGGRWAGVAILAREQPTDPAIGLPGEPAVDEARWIEATVAGVRVVSVYVPNGRAPDTPTYADKLRFLEAMAERIGTLAGGPLVVAGDFNVCPTDRDVYDPAAFVGATHVTAPERERFAALLDAGVVDAFRELHPDEPGFTWWDYRRGHFHRKMGLRIDAHLVSPPLAGRIAACGIDRDFRKGTKPSDHAPLLLELSD